MYVYVFEDGIVQRHSRGPTLDDRKAIDDGRLIVLSSNSEIRCVGPDLKEVTLTDCALVQKPLSERHVPS